MLGDGRETLVDHVESGLRPRPRLVGEKPSSGEQVRGLSARHGHERDPES